jgi:hypothetical protein
MARACGLRPNARGVHELLAAALAAARGEALPFVGVKVIAAATGYEFNLACETMRNFYDLQMEIDPAQAKPVVRNMACGLQVPTRDELWSSIKTAADPLWGRAVGAAEGTVDRAGTDLIIKVTPQTCPMH